MLDSKNTEKLKDIATDSDTPPATRVSACTLLYRLSALPAKDILNIFQSLLKQWVHASFYEVADFEDGDDYWHTHIL